MSGTPIYVDTEVVAEVMRLSGSGSPQSAVDAALREYIHSRRRTEARIATRGPADLPEFQPLPPTTAQG